jgi:hypothetical protein
MDYGVSLTAPGIKATDVLLNGVIRTIISLRPNPIVNVNANVLKLVSCMTSFFMHLS